MKRQSLLCYDETTTDSGYHWLRNICPVIKELQRRARCPAAGRMPLSLVNGIDCEIGKGRRQMGIPESYEARWQGSWGTRDYAEVVEGAEGIVLEVWD